MDRGRSDHHIDIAYYYIFGHIFGAHMGHAGYPSIRPLGFSRDDGAWGPSTIPVSNLQSFPYFQ